MQGKPETVVMTASTLLELVPRHGPGVAAGRLLPLLTKRRFDAAKAAWQAHILGARRVMAERGVAPEIVAVAIRTLTDLTRTEIDRRRAEAATKPKGEVVAFRAAGGER